MLSAVSKLADRARRSLEFHRLRLASEHWRKRFSVASPGQYINEPCGRELPGVELVSLCHKAGIPLASLCMLSFLRHVGTPEAWTIVSDGSIDEAARDHLRRVCSTVRFTLWSDYVNDQNREAVELYAKKSGWAKKLALVTGLRPERTCLYTDTDIVFFEGGAHLHDLLSHPGRNRFLLDNDRAIYPPFHTPAELALPPVNVGFLIQSQPVPWQEPLDRLVEFFRQNWDLCDDPKGLQHLEPSVGHVGYHLSGAEPLPREYIIELDDAFELAEPCLRPDTVMRHYVVHTRMKFWLHARPYLA